MRQLCFSSNVNSWTRIHFAFQAVLKAASGYDPQLQTSSICLPTFQKMLKEIYPGIPIRRQIQSCDACDTCVTFDSEKRNFTTIANQVKDGKRNQFTEEEKAKFLLLLYARNSHLELSYRERQYYKAKFLQAQRDYENISHKLVDQTVSSSELNNVVEDSW